MRGADSYNESLFTTVRLEDFVPATHPLRPIRTWVNDAFERITGFSAQEGMGRMPGELLEIDPDDQVVQRMREALAQAQAFQGEVLNRHKNGEKHWLQLEIQPLRHPDGTLNGFMAIAADICIYTNRNLVIEELHA